MKWSDQVGILSMLAAGEAHTEQCRCGAPTSIIQRSPRNLHGRACCIRDHTGGRPCAVRWRAHSRSVPDPSLGVYPWFLSLSTSARDEPEPADLEILPTNCSLARWKPCSTTLTFPGEMAQRTTAMTAFVRVDSLFAYIEPCCATTPNSRCSLQLVNVVTAGRRLALEDQPPLCSWPSPLPTSRTAPRTQAPCPHPAHAGSSSTQPSISDSATCGRSRRCACFGHHRLVVLGKLFVLLHSRCRIIRALPASPYLDATVAKSEH